jgi:hypothetical protein
MSDPKSVDEWLRLAARHETAARLLVTDKKAASLGFDQAGRAVECALKAYIMRKERLNRWPEKDSRPELYTHDLRQLRRIAGIKLNYRDRTSPGWHTVQNWDRNQSYDPKPMPRKVAASMLEAAFGKDGVVTWIRLSLK